jgi:TRAP-type mannitol/chloroaromatic compound transport system permease small subunit
MTFVSATNAILRYVGKIIGQNLTSNAMVEAQWQLFAASFLLGGAYVLASDKHVRVDVWYSRRKSGTKALVNIIGTLVFLIPFCLFGIWSSWDYVLNSWARWEVSNSSGGLPLFPIKTLIPISFFLLFLQGLALLVKSMFPEDEP